MIRIRPVSDLRNKFTQIEQEVHESGPVYLTKNGYGNMVVLSIEDYARLTDETEQKLLEADREAMTTDKRYAHTEIFSKARRRIKANAKKIQD
jgi:prevent-host-death family protein